MPLDYSSNKALVDNLHSASPSEQDSSRLSGQPCAAVKVFLDGDCMRLKQTRRWLIELAAKHERVDVFEAGGPGRKSAGRKLLVPGLPSDRVYFQEAKTNCRNAADVVLTYLYSKHAGELNYVLSQDEQWFGELQYADPSVRTIWLRFSELQKDGTSRLSPSTANFECQERSKTKLRFVFSSDPVPSSVKVFVDGDAMSAKSAQVWMKDLCAQHKRVEVFKAVGAGRRRTDAVVAKRKLLQLVHCVSSDQVYIQQAVSGTGNAVHAVLTYLYGKYAGELNYILSDGDTNEFLKELVALPQASSSTTLLCISDLP